MKRTWCSRLLGNIRYYSSEEAMSIIISNWYDSLTALEFNRAKMYECECVKETRKLYC